MISPEEGIALLETAVYDDAAQIAALRLNIDQLPTRWRERSLFAALNRSSSETQVGVRHESEFLRDYWKAPEDQKRSLLLNHLQSLVARTLGIESPTSVAVDQALSDMGLDSLASLELGNNLEESLRVPIPSTLVYDYPTLNSMADYFLQHLPADASTTGTASGVASPKEPTSSSNKDVDCKDPTPQRHKSPDSHGDQSAPGSTIDPDDLLQSIQDLSDELDRWDEA